MPVVSVIMPTFNAAPFIGAAIDSLQAQTMTDWELIVADDGSTDATLDIVRQRAVADTRIKIADRVASGNPAQARLRALRHAVAEWVFALDADDLIAPDFLVLLLTRQKETDADAVLCRLDKFETDTAASVPFMPASGFDTLKVYPGRELLTATFHGWSIPANGIFRRTDYTSVSQEVLALAPDNPYADEHIGRLLIHRCTKVAFAPAQYFYRVNSSSVTQAHSARRLKYLATNLLLRDFVLREYGESSPEATEVNLHIYHALVGAMLSLGRTHWLSAADRREVVGLMRDTYRAIDFSRIALSGPISQIMRLGFGPARVILSAYGRFRS